MNEVVLTGLDGSNPLGFLAALGLLNVLSDAHHDEAPRLSWRDEGAWRPVIHSSVPDISGLVKTIRLDLKAWKKEPAIQLRYPKGGKGKEAWDLKPPPEFFSGFLRRILDDTTPASRRSADFAAAFAAEGVTDNNGNTKPTAFHFTAGQQEFLQMVDTVIEEVTDDDVENALVGPWRYDRELPVLNWDSTSTRDYALRAKDPAKEKLGVPGADWLAFRGLSFLPVVPFNGRLVTTGCFGEWKTGRFRWPLWSPALERATIRTVLALGKDTSSGERRLRGIPVCFESAIRRSDQGGYGSFLPSAIV